MRANIHFSCKQLSSTVSGNKLSFQSASNIHTLFDNQWDSECVGLIVSMCAMLKQLRNMEILHNVSVGQPKRLILMGQDQCETLNDGGRLIKPHCFSSGSRVA